MRIHPAPSLYLLSVLLAPALFAQSEGLPPEWEVRKSVQELVEKLKPVGPLLEKLDAGEWVARGAPPLYRDHLKGARDQFEYCLSTAGRMAQTPDRLSIAIETGLRMQSFEFALMSVAEVVRRYQNGAIADMIVSQFGESAQQRDKLRQYIITLATAKEQELAVADREAQRCRDIISKQPAPRPAPAPVKKGVSK